MADIYFAVGILQIKSIERKFLYAVSLEVQLTIVLQ